MASSRHRVECGLEAGIGDRLLSRRSPALRLIAYTSTLRVVTTMMRLDHVNVHVYDLAAARDFLIALLGVEVGWRPSFKVPGEWLYLNGQPVIHTWLKSQDRGLGWADHVAFAPCGDPDAKRDELSRLGLKFTESRLPDTEIVQFMVMGPEGIKIELQCPH